LLEYDSRIIQATNGKGSALSFGEVEKIYTETIEYTKYMLRENR